MKTATIERRRWALLPRLIVVLLIGLVPLISSSVGTPAEATTDPSWVEAELEGDLPLCLAASTTLELRLGVDEDTPVGVSNLLFENKGNTNLPLPEWDGSGWTYSFSNLTEDTLLSGYVEVPQGTDATFSITAYTPCEEPDDPIDLGDSGTDQSGQCDADYFKVENAESQLFEGTHDYVGVSKDGSPFAFTATVTLDSDGEVDTFELIDSDPTVVTIIAKAGTQFEVFAADQVVDMPRALSNLVLCTGDDKPEPPEPPEPPREECPEGTTRGQGVTVSMEDKGYDTPATFVDALTDTSVSHALLEYDNSPDSKHPARGMLGGQMPVNYDGYVEIFDEPIWVLYEGPFDSGDLTVTSEDDISSLLITVYPCEDDKSDRELAELKAHGDLDCDTLQLYATNRSSDLDGNVNFSIDGEISTVSVTIPATQTRLLASVTLDEPTFVRVTRAADGQVLLERTFSPKDCPEPTADLSGQLSQVCVVLEGEPDGVVVDHSVTNDGDVEGSFTIVDVDGNKLYTNSVAPGQTVETDSADSQLHFNLSEGEVALRLLDQNGNVLDEVVFNTQDCVKDDSEDEGDKTPTKDDSDDEGKTPPKKDEPKDDSEEPTAAPVPDGDDPIAHPRTGVDIINLILFAIAVGLVGYAGLNLSSRLRRKSHA